MKAEGGLGMDEMKAFAVLGVPPDSPFADVCMEVGVVLRSGDEIEERVAVEVFAERLQVGDRFSRALRADFQFAAVFGLFEELVPDSLSSSASWRRGAATSRA